MHFADHPVVCPRSPCFLAHICHARGKSPTPGPWLYGKLLHPSLLMGDPANIWNTAPRIISRSVYSCPITCLPERSTDGKNRLLAVAYQLLAVTLSAACRRYYAACSGLGAASERLYPRPPWTQACSYCGYSYVRMSWRI